MTATLPPGWTDLGDGVRVRQSRLFQMNPVVVTAGTHVTLVDPGILPSELDEIAAVATPPGSGEVTLLFTHGDWDHVLGLPWWPGAATIGHDTLAATLHRDEAVIREEADRVAAGAGERWPRPFEAFSPRQRAGGLHETRLGGEPAVLRDAFGHSASMLSLHLPARRLLAAADMLSDLEIPGLTQPVAAYRRTLEELLPLAEGGAIETLVPGHGGIARGAAEVIGRIRTDLRYLDDLEGGVRRAIASGLDAEAAIEALAGVDFAGREGDPAYPCSGIHRENVRLVLAGERAR